MSLDLSSTTLDLIKAVNDALNSKLSLSGGTLTGNVLLSNSKAQGSQPNLKWKTINSKTPYVGYCTGSTDGTFMIASIGGTTYTTGLSIGGSSGNLLWKGTQVATKSDIPTALKNPKALKFGSKTYDGSSAQTITASDIGAELSGAASNALASAKSYADTAIANLVNSAPETLNTLGELAKAIQDHESEYDALLQTVGSKVKKTTQTATVIGTSKTTEAIGEYQLVFPKGAVFRGTAASAGLVTRGICGVTTPDANGSCSKDNLYINYDGDNEYRSPRQLVLQAGQVGTHYGNNLYQYCAARGDAVKGYVDANTIKSLSASGTTITYTKGDGTKGAITTQDTKVKQTHVSDRMLCSLALLPNNTSSEVTDQVYKNTSLYANPDRGALYATSFYENGTALSSKYALKSSVSTYTLPLAASGTRGGIQIGYTASGANIPLRLSSEKGYVALTKSAVISAIGNGTATSLYNGLPTAGSNFTVTNISSYRYLIIGIIDNNNNYIVNMLPTNYVKTLNSSSKKICVADDTSYATFWYVSNTSFRLNSIYSYVAKVVVLGVN